MARYFYGCNDVCLRITSPDGGILRANRQYYSIAFERFELCSNPVSRCIRTMSNTTSKKIAL